MASILFGGLVSLALLSAAILLCLIFALHERLLGGLGTPASGPGQHRDAMPLPRS